MLSSCFSVVPHPYISVLYYNFNYTPSLLRSPITQLVVSLTNYGERGKYKNVIQIGHIGGDVKKFHIKVYKNYGSRTRRKPIVELLDSI